MDIICVDASFNEDQKKYWDKFKNLKDLNTEDSKSHLKHL